MIYIEHSGRVWYNYNRHRNGRYFAEHRTSRASRPSLRISRYTQKSIILHHKCQVFKHLGVLMTNKHLFSRPKTSTISVNLVILSNFFRVGACPERSRMDLWLKNPCNPCNPWLINDLHVCKKFYNCRETITDVMSALQIHLFMQNKANFRKTQMNLTTLLTMEYEEMDTWSIRKTKPIQSQSKPIQSQLKPIKCQNKAKTNPISEEKMLYFKISINIYHFRYG